ncbi:SH3 domain-containing protein [Vallitalea pronyensis]|uniref:SH3 domain-containing protein n=1 Tax=Vallitalea pronyensis TaxID=1348613 RepID=A0A8J8MLC0_9FIRM|nr:SH3 domain-containing protein [Vallitalea pronyensis]QUI23616.1 SH3 domain-containing protein [Vallitalea pronyensis]
MKKILTLSICLILLVSATSIPVSAAQFATVTADVLNVRSGPGLSHSVIGKLYEGDRVQVLSGSTPSDGYNWVEIWDDNLHGWVAVEYLGPIG